MNKNVLFVTGIDTNVGKTIATGYLARELAQAGKRVITQKMIQTGCEWISEDIEMHRKVQGIGLLEEDRSGLTCPYLFSYPCSPHRAAEIDGVTILPEKIAEATAKLCKNYDIVLLEGAGGLMVPVTNDWLTIDYVREQGYPVVLVTSGVLGSINHTLLSLFACRQYGIFVDTVVYNQFPAEDAYINQDTQAYLEGYLQREFPSTRFVVLPALTV